MNTSGSLVRASVLRILVVLFIQTLMLRMTEAQNVPAVFVFGDSYLDTGNNDYITAGIKANFPPYGSDFIGHVPSGRFSNGKLMPDYFVKGLGIKDLLPPYLDPNIQDSDLITGVNFASSGSGLDNITNNIMIYLSYIKELHDLNARRIGLINIPPLGCLPASKTLRNYSQIKGECVKEVNQGVSLFNGGLNTITDKLKFVLPGLKIVSVDYYGLVLDLMANPGKWGIEVSDKACCVTGDIELAAICNRLTPFACPDADKYIFFDDAHFTEKAYEIISRIFLSREILQLL